MEKSEQRNRHFNRLAQGKIYTIELLPRPLPDLVEFLVSDQPISPLSAHPEWNDNGCDEAIPSEMFVEIFHRLDLDTVIDLRAVCSRFRSLIDMPHHQLHLVPFTLETSWINDSQRLSMINMPEDELFNRIKKGVSLFSDEFFHAGHLQCVHTTKGDIRFTSQGETIDIRFPSDGFDFIERNPTCFTSLILKHRWYDEIQILGTVNMAKVVQLPLEAQAPFANIIKTQDRYWEPTINDSICRFFTHLRVRNMAWLQSENSGVVTVDSLKSQQPLHPYQLHCIDWMQQFERKVWLGKPIGHFDYQTRHSSFMRGTPLCWDLYHSTEGQLVLGHLGQRTKPNLKLYARGAFIADQVGLGKTREVVTFFLGCPPDLNMCRYLREQGDPTTTAGTPPKDRLLLTHALNFGNYTGPLLGEVPLGLLYTRASLIVCRNSLISNWVQEAKKSYPHKKIIVLTMKAEHVKITYADMATADLVIVSTQFLSNKDHYGKIRHGNDMAGVTRCADMLLRYQVKVLKRFSRLCDESALALDGLKNLAKTTCPLLDLFAWPRMAIDEVHEHIRSKPGPAAGIYLSGVVFFSVRTMWLISATHGDSLKDTVTWNKLPSSAFYWHNMYTLLDCGTTKTPKGNAIPGRRGYATKEGFKTMYTSALHDWQISISLKLDIGPLERDMAPRFLTALTTCFIQALFWQNTTKNTEVFTRTPTIQRARAEVPIHPLVDFLRTQSFGDGQAVWCLKDMPFDTSGSYQTPAAFPLGSYAETATRFRADLDESVFAVEAEASFMEMATVEYMLTKGYAPDKAEVKLLKYRRKANEKRDQLQAYHDRMVPLLDRVLQEPFWDDTERTYGTKVSLLMRYLDYLFAHQPKAQVVIGTCYTKAMFKALKTLLIQRGITVAALGGQNVSSTLKNLALFQSGQAQVALLNANHTASGLNLQNAHYIIVLGELAMSKDTLVQLEGRVARQGNCKQPVVLEIK